MKKILGIIGIAFLLGCIVCYLYPLVYYFNHDWMTIMQFFKRMWFFYIIGMVFYFVYLVIEGISNNKSDKY